VHLFRLNSAEILRRNSRRIGGFKERKFEADSAIKEVATQTRLSRANAIQFRTQKINKPPKIRIVVQRDPLGVHKAGVTIAFGTDMGMGPHGQNAREFGFVVEAGMRSSEAIKAATVNAAKLLDLSDEVGTIASAKSADVIAVESSPLDDVSVLQRVAFVMARGDVYLGVT